MLISQRPTLTEEVDRREPVPVRHRAAGARLRLHPRQLASAHAAVVHPRRGRHQHPHRRRAARVHHRPRGEGGRHRHHPEPQGLVVSAPRRTSRSPCTCASRAPVTVTAGDIVPPAGVTVHNPDLHIATLNDKGKLEVELVVERGRGYVPAVQNKAVRRRDRPHPGRLDLLAGAQGDLQGRGHPRRAAHRLRPADPRRRDQASITPRDALASAGKTLVELFGLARELNVDAEGIEIGPSPAEADHIAAVRAADRGAGPHRPVLQLPQARGHPHRRRAGRPHRVRPAGHPQLRRRSPSTRSRSSCVGWVSSLKDSPATFDPSEVAGYDVATGHLEQRRRLRRGRRPGLRRNRAAVTAARASPLGDTNAQAHQGSSPRRVVRAPAAILANLATSLFEHGRITTTEAKAGRLRPVRREADHPRQEGHAAQPA